jgi:hypothetical protein
MISAHQIAQMNQQAQTAAKMNNLEPVQIWSSEWEVWIDAMSAGYVPTIPLQHLPREYCEELGYQHVETYFVDATGWGDPDEPALTQLAFLGEASRITQEELMNNQGVLYWALTEVGQFQVYVSCYRK